MCVWCFVPLLKLVSVCTCVCANKQLAHVPQPNTHITMLPCTMHRGSAHTPRGTPTRPMHHHMHHGWRLHRSQPTTDRWKYRAGNPPGGEPSSSGDELLQERLVDVLRVQINQKEVEDFTEQKKQELTQVAEEVRWVSLACAVQHYPPDQRASR